MHTDNPFADLDDEMRRRERCFFRRLGFGLFFALALAIVLGPLAGCAAAGAGPLAGVCAVRTLGENDAGVTFIRYQCQPR